MFAYDVDVNGRRGRTVLLQYGFLQNAFPQGVKGLVYQAIQLLGPFSIVTYSPDYKAVASGFEEPTWVNFAQGLSGAVKGADLGELVVLGDSWATPLWQIASIDCKFVAFRVPRVGEHRRVLVDKYEAMAVRCGEPENFAKYKAAFPLLPEDPALAARIFRGAAKSGLYEGQDFGSNVVAVRGFHDDLFHPASALEKVNSVDTVDEALRFFGLI